MNTTDITQLVAVSGGGAAGAVARFLVDRLVMKISVGRTVSYGTLVANVTGSALLGILLSCPLITEAEGNGSLFTLALGVGLCGALTTFSTLSYQSVELFIAHNIMGALINIGANLICGILAAVFGLSIAEFVWP